MLITNGNERLTIPTEAGREQLCNMGSTLPGTDPVSASKSLPWRPPSLATFSYWGLGPPSSTEDPRDLPLQTLSRCPSDL